MNHWQKIEEAVALASSIPENKRAAWLTEFCAGDEALKSEIESLLVFELSAKGFLENSPAPFARLILPENEDHNQGKEFGHYTIIREIGRGGMGAVFLAQRSDGEFDQQVALKIVRQTIVDRESENRFRRERQILASLNHPHIARLLDGGVSANGEPFLVMEYVAGKPLLDFAAADDSDVDERLELFLKICAAVAYAHRNLIVHRDIKPANILVTGDAEPKLLDFGLAKILDESLSADDTQTATAFRAMTPAYASPEQMRGEIVTTASDIYSLGVVLYELLTGNRPFQPKTNSFEEIVRQISTFEPLKPSAAENTNPQTAVFNSHLKGDLDNIVLTALRKEPERRYPTVAAFAEDIRKHLDGLPVSARANTFGYRAGKFIRRNSAISAAVLLIFITLIGGAAMSVWQARRTAQQRDRAEKRFNDVRRLSTSLLFEISPQIERLPGSTQARETIVKRALEYLDSLADEENADESLQSELASAYEQVGNVQGKPGNPNLGDLKGAVESYRKAQIIRLNLMAEHPNDFETRRLLAVNYYAIGDLRWWSSKVEEAAENYTQAILIYDELAAEQPENIDVKVELIRSQMARAKVYSGNAEYENSIPIYQRAAVALEELRQNNPSNAELARLAGGCHINLGYDLSWQDKMAEAGAEVKKSLAIGERLAADYPNDTKILHSLWYSYYFAASIYQEANPPLAQQYLEKSINPAKQVADTDKLNFQSRQDLAESYSLLGEISDSQKRSDKAIEMFGKALVILNELTNDEPQHTGYFFDTANTYTRLGETEEGKNDLPNARQSFANALAILEQLHDKDAADNMSVRGIAYAYQNLGQIFGKMNQCEQAEIYAQKSSALFVQLEQKNALSDYDKNRIGKLPKAAPNCQ